MQEYEVAVVIGRFQPLHNGHMNLIREGLRIANKVVVVIGSANAAPNIRNPWTADERIQMIEDSSDHPISDRVKFEKVRDYFYNENAWIADVQTKVARHYRDGDSVALVGNYKDGSSYYLKHFPQWDLHIGREYIEGLSATDIRDVIFDQPRLRPDWEGKAAEGSWSVPATFGKLPRGTRDLLKDYLGSERFVNCCKEYEHIKNYRESWASAPFPPTFVTADAIVVCSGHILVIKRKIHPGKGLYALPGGFIKQDEFIEDAAIRELREETGIKVDKLILKSSIDDSNVFDHPQRSLRGRTITHGFHIKLRGDLPEVKAGDDASEAFWMPLMDLGSTESKWFEDHWHIAHYFVNRD